ncbi:MAG TPA: hypothetical protein VJ487_19495 [Alphaproteobacteria bacterium]|nr:hypothetical protein [Alphaproteobacteria bacterium]
MRAILKLAALAAVAFLAFGTPSYATNPLVGGSSQPTVLSDKELDGVKGSGYYAQYYGYYGYLYSYYAYLYSDYGYYYAYYDGPNGTGTSYLYSAYSYATYAANNLSLAYYYAYYGM